MPICTWVFWVLKWVKSVTLEDGDTIIDVICMDVRASFSLKNP
jgi:hypothetical protein